MCAVWVVWGLLISTIQDLVSCRKRCTACQPHCAFHAPHLPCAQCGMDGCAAARAAGASLDYAADSTLRPGQLSPSTSPMPGAAPSRAGPTVGGGRTSVITVGAAGGAGGSEAWFGPSSGSIGQGASRPVSSRPGAGRPVSAKPPTGNARPVSAMGNGAGAAGVVTLSAQERRTIEGKLIASMGLAGTGLVRGESPQGQWAHTRSAKSGAGTAAPGASGSAARPVSAPRAYANTGGSSRPVSATMAVAAAAAASKRRASATQAAGGGAAAVASLRPISALPGSGGMGTGSSRPVSGMPYGSGARGPMTVTVTPGEEVTLQPHAAPQVRHGPAAALALTRAWYQALNIGVVCVCGGHTVR